MGTVTGENDRPGGASALGRRHPVRPGAAIADHACASQADAVTGLKVPDVNYKCDHEGHCRHVGNR